MRSEAVGTYCAGSASGTVAGADQATVCSVDAGGLDVSDNVDGPSADVSRAVLSTPARVTVLALDASVASEEEPEERLLVTDEFGGARLSVAPGGTSQLPSRRLGVSLDLTSPVVNWPDPSPFGLVRVMS